MSSLVEQGTVLLFLATIVVMVARRLRFPYVVGLVCAGFAVASVWDRALVIELSRGLLFTVLLPPLIFDGALRLPWRALRRDLLIVIALATVGVLLNAAITSAAMHGIAGWPTISALAFGALVAATDPVTVIATFRDLGIGGRIRMIVEAESLFNDGTAAVLFGLVASIAGGGAVTPEAIAANLSLAIGGGIACGIAVAFIARFLAGQSPDPVTEIACTLVAAYGSFLLAERLGGSGVIATLSAGLIFGSNSAAVRPPLVAFWDFVAFAANSLVFLLIGVQLAREASSLLFTTSVLAVAAATAGRAASVYPVAALFSRSEGRLSSTCQHLLVWGGLRGALALALALGLPSAIPARQTIISATFGVVAFSIVVQGITIAPLLRFLGIAKEPGVSKQAPRTTRS